MNSTLCSNFHVSRSPDSHAETNPLRARLARFATQGSMYFVSRGRCSWHQIVTRHHMQMMQLTGVISDERWNLVQGCVGFICGTGAKSREVDFLQVATHSARCFHQEGTADTLNFEHFLEVRSSSGSKTSRMYWSSVGFWVTSFQTDPESKVLVFATLPI